MIVEISPERDSDIKGIRAVHIAAFPTSAEADLVDRLRADGDAEISLVGRFDGEIVGHALLSRMRVTGGTRSYRALGLAPVAVLPARQRQGIGEQLIRAALDAAHAVGEEIVFVLGELDYYGRFGFSAAAASPFASPYVGPFFMAKLFADAEPRRGIAEYAPAFATLS